MSQVDSDAAKRSPRPVAMRHGDGAVLLGCIAALTLWMGLGNGMLRYIRSSMRPWLVLAGACLALLALATAVAAWLDWRREHGATPKPGHEDQRTHRPPVVGWLLLLPVLVTIGISPGGLGAYAIRQGTAFTSQSGGDFDLAAHLRTHSLGGHVPRLQQREFLDAAYGDEDDQALLASTRVRLVGFIVNRPDADHPLELGRLMIGCCANTPAEARRLPQQPAPLQTH